MNRKRAFKISRRHRVCFVKVMSSFARPQLRRDIFGWQTRHVILAVPQMLRSGNSQESRSSGLSHELVEGISLVVFTCAQHSVQWTLGILARFQAVSPP